MAKSKFTPEQRANISKEYLDGISSSIELSRKYNVDDYTIRRWTQRYKENGLSAFLRENTKYTADFKLSCVELYYNGKMSIDDIVAKYNISLSSVLLKWIMCYNANRKLKDYNPKKEVYMAESRRKTTIKERKLSNIV